MSQSIIQSPPLEAIDSVRIIRRAEIPSLNSVRLGAADHSLGVLKDFRRHPALRSFIPENARPAMSWVSLKRGEVLTPHVHPIDSMILICKGSVLSLGEVQAQLHEGDILIVPRGHAHGFQGTGTDGFWGISMQFEQRGLYEEADEPLVQFLDATVGTLATETSILSFPELMERNEILVGEFERNSLFALVKSGYLAEKEKRERFLSYFQVWSNFFQKMVLARVLFCEEGNFSQVAERHLIEEFGHNRKLQKSRGNTKAPWDALLEATSAWFASKMSTLDDASKWVLVHFVVEVSADIFYKHTSPVFKTSTVEDHFSLHQHLDHDHSQLGIELVQNLRAEEYMKLGEVQWQGWQMLNEMFSRIATLVSEE